LSINDTRIKVEDFSAQRGQRKTIDFLFRSMAREFGDKSIGILLSGTGTDGTLGLREIKGVNGIAIVQDPESAEYNDMPRNAIESLKIDYILPPEKIPEKVAEYVNSYYTQLEEKAKFNKHEVNRGLDILYQLVYERTGHQFSAYKESTIIRRIKKRMGVNQIYDFNEYIEYLQSFPTEVDKLFQEFLIGVTNFFRDKESFEALEKKIVPKLFQTKTSDDTIRVWVPGCSTGEEAYSIAILLQQYKRENELPQKIQIFATDIDTQSIETARRGSYLDNISVDVSQERLDRYFVSKGNQYIIKKSIRNMIIFAEQNVLSDPPYSNVDLISCRNFLIYLKQEYQEKLLNIFHYALNEQGYLFLGKSAAISDAKRLFTEEDSSHKIFKYKQAPDTYKKEFNIFPPLFDYSVTEIPEYEIPKREIKKVDYEKVIKTQLLDYYTPPSILINQDKDILYVYGRTGQFLEPAEGKATVNILNMARKGLKIKLSTAIRKAETTGDVIKMKNVNIQTNGEEIIINLIVRPINEPESMKGLFLIIFEEINTELADIPQEKLTEEIDKVSNARIKQLENELDQTKKYLQSTIEELETKNEELKSTNEELQSSNEELRSTNEELQTSKEELQSVNEELSTVNSELQEKNQELKEANDDLRNLMNSTEIATVFVDNQLKIKRYTPKATEIFSLIQSDIGRPISDISSTLEYKHLSDDIKKALDDLKPIEKDLKTENNRWYRLRISLYKTEENVIDGAVVTFYNITVRKLAENELEKTKEKFRDSYNQLRLYKDLFTHDMRNLLQVILSSMELAENIYNEDAKSEKLYEYIQTSKQQTSKSFKLIENIEKLTAIDIEEIQKSPIDLIYIIENAKSYILDTYPEEKLKFEISTPKEEIPVLASNILEDVFENIFLNAIKYNDSQTKKLWINISSTHIDGREYAKIEIEDNGMGISSPIREKLFKGKIDSSHSGMGIGLLIVNRILNLYNGEISIEDRVEGERSKGTRVIIRLPKNQ
jgi:two-component system CheB/CheR fusion protein